MFYNPVFYGFVYYEELRELIKLVLIKKMKIRKV